MATCQDQRTQQESRRRNGNCRGYSRRRDPLVDKAICVNLLATRWLRIGQANSKRFVQPSCWRRQRTLLEQSWPLLEKIISLSQKDLRLNSASVHGTAFVRVFRLIIFASAWKRIRHALTRSTDPPQYSPRLPYEYPNRLLRHTHCGLSNCPMPSKFFVSRKVLG
jgi:hypothetical protein